MPKAASKYSISKHSGGGYRTKFTLDGKTIYIYGKTRNEVQTKLRAKLYSVEQAKASQLNNFMDGERMTVEQWARICLETYSKVSVRETTYAGYLSIVDHHLSILGDYKLAEVTNAMIQAHLQREARGPGNEEGLGEEDQGDRLAKDRESTLHPQGGCGDTGGLAAGDKERGRQRQEGDLL